MDGDETRWRPPSVLFIPLILCGGLIFFVDVFQLQSFKMSTASLRLPPPRFLGYSEGSNLKGFLIKTDGCRIPDMDAFSPAVAHCIFQEQVVVCNNNTPPLVESNLTSLYVLRTSLPAYGISDISALRCCYSVFKRLVPSSRESDNKIAFSKKCVKFNQVATISDEFVRVTCSLNGSEIYKDFFSFVPLKSEITKVEPSPLNILVVGLDAVSRLNLHRQMPKTIDVLKDLGAVEFLGYNKVGDNTFPNLIPVLTGLTEEELVKECWPSNHDRFDKCPFIWKNYSKNGFTTAFGEDSAWMGIFNYVKQGFAEAPTDYFWGPFNQIVEHQIGNKHKMNVFQCVGGRLVYKTLLDYIAKYAETMHINKISNFGFFWGASLSHDYLNTPKLGDTDYANFFKHLEDHGILNNTVFVFMSDHGIRWGSIRTTYQGRMEERLPFLFITLPKWYRETYLQPYMNLRRNTRRLTTPFDLHETLKDLLNPYALTQDAINDRIKSRITKRGYSLFEPIPNNRSCEDAGIVSHWCTCQQSTDLDKNNQLVMEAAKFAVNHINSKLEGYAECANLSLAEVYNARLHYAGENVLVGKNDTHDYTVALRTTPGDAIFEVTVRQSLHDKDPYSFGVIGTISRINLYGKQSLCITDFHLKLYCYCIT